MRKYRWLIGAMVTGVAALPSLARADVKLDPAHETLGHGVQEVVAGKYDKAARDIQQALRLDPELGEPAHYNLAVALRNLGRLDDAVAEYHRAAQLATSEDEKAQALYGEGLAKEAMADHDAWRDYLAFAKPKRVEQPAVQIAEEHDGDLNGRAVPGTRKASINRTTR